MKKKCDLNLKAVKPTKCRHIPNRLSEEEIRELARQFAEKMFPKWEKYCKICGACNCKNNDNCINCNCQF